MRRVALALSLALFVGMLVAPMGASAVPLDNATRACLTKKFGAKAAAAIAKAKTLNPKQKRQLAACTTPPPDPGGGGSSSEFPFQNLTLDFASDPWLWSSAKDLGPFQPIKIFGRDYNGYTESALTFMMLKIGTPVISPVNGKVLEIRDQPVSKDVELYIISDDGLIFSIDHVKTTLNGPVFEGDTGVCRLNCDRRTVDVVKVGDVIATVPSWEGEEVWGGYEFMYVRPEKNLAYCPVNHLVPTAVAAAKADIRAVMEKWASMAGSATGNPYRPEDFDRGACELAEVPLKK